MTVNELIRKLTTEFRIHTDLDGEDEATPQAITQLHALLTGFLSDAIGERQVVTLLAAASHAIAARHTRKEQVH